MHYYELEGMNNGVDVRQRSPCDFYPEDDRFSENGSRRRFSTHVNTRLIYVAPMFYYEQQNKQWFATYVCTASEITPSARMIGRSPTSRAAHQDLSTIRFPLTLTGTPFAVYGHTPGCWRAECLTWPRSDAHVQLLSARSCSARPRECGPPLSAWRGLPSRLPPATLAAAPSVVAPRLRTARRQPGTRQKSLENKKKRETKHFHPLTDIIFPVIFLDGHQPNYY